MGATWSGKTRRVEQRAINTGMSAGAIPARSTISTTSQPVTKVVSAPIGTHTGTKGREL